MDWLTVEHPVTHGRARIAESALPFHLRAGWQVAAGPGPAAPAAGGDADQPAGDSQAGDDEQQPAKTSRRRADDDEKSGE